jgi:hypothetical protein
MASFTTILKKDFNQKFNRIFSLFEKRLTSSNISFENVNYPCDNLNTKVANYLVEQLNILHNTFKSLPLAFRELIGEKCILNITNNQATKYHYCWIYDIKENMPKNQNAIDDLHYLCINIISQMDEDKRSFCEMNMLISMCFIHWALNYEGFYFVDKYYLPATKNRKSSRRWYKILLIKKPEIIEVKIGIDAEIDQLEKSLLQIAAEFPCIEWATRHTVNKPDFIKYIPKLQVKESFENKIKSLHSRLLELQRQKLMDSNSHKQAEEAEDFEEDEEQINKIQNEEDEVPDSWEDLC